MRRPAQITLCALLALSTSGCAQLEQFSSLLSADGIPGTDSIAAGLREALRKGTEKAVNDLARPGGFSGSRSIGLPSSLQGPADKLRKIGFAAHVDKFEGLLNTAAEKATPAAASIFAKAISSLTLDDVNGILHGGPTAATDYLRKSSLAEVRAAVLPVIRGELEKVGAVADFNNLRDKYNALPLVTPIKAGPDDYVAERSCDAIFASLAAMETDIRSNPAARTSELLRKVFAMQDKK